MLRVENAELDAKLDELSREADVREALGEDCEDAVPLGEVPVRGYDRPVTVWQLG